MPGPRSPRVKNDGGRVPIYTTLERLLVEWRDDPEKLATAAVAMSLYGHPASSIIYSAASSYERRPGEGWIQTITEDEARDRLQQAFFRKNRRRLLHRGEGLLWALESLAADADATRLHRVQVDACVIDCRQLPTEERIAKLRAQGEPSREAVHV